MDNAFGTLLSVFSRVFTLEVAGYLPEYEQTRFGTRVYLGIIPGYDQHNEVWPGTRGPTRV